MTLDEDALRVWGERIGRAVEPPAWLALYGDLGAGKSVLARAVARGAGVTAPMPSPTFNLLYPYDAAAGKRLVHIDLYRIEDPGAVRELGWQELGAADEIVIVEWAERAGPLLPEQRWDIFLTLPPDTPSLREVEVVARGGAPQLPAWDASPSSDRDG